MSRLPSRPFGNNPSSSESTEKPLLSAGNSPEDTQNAPRIALNTPSHTAEAKTPQNVSASLPAPPMPPHLSNPNQTQSNAAPQPAPAPKAIPTPVEEPALSVESEAPSIENLNFDQTVTEQEIEEQARRESAINKLPENLKQSIKKLFELIMDDTSSEVTLSGPRSIGIKKGGSRFFDNQIDFIDTNTYHAIINSFILPLTNTHERIGTTPHLIEAQLVVQDPAQPDRPLVARLHIIAPPAVENAKITIAKKARTQYTVDSMVQKGSLTNDMAQFLKDLSKGRATMVFSGLSGSGKTTLAEAISREFDLSDRVILVEDTEELSLPVSDVVALRSHQARPGDDVNSSVSLEWLVRQAQRMRPDRIIVGECRGAEMAEFLTAANSGADGSMTTIHASGPQQAIAKMLSLSLKSASVKSETSVLRDIASTVQIIVQLSLIDGRHVVSQIEEVSSTVNQNGLGIQTSTIYRYDRNTGRFTFENRPSDELQQFLKQRSVQITIPTNFMNPRY